MGVFGKKDKEVVSTPCSCGKNCAPNAGAPKTEESTGNGYKSVKILGTGCSKCNQLEKATVEALKELGMDSDVGHITDFSEIAAYGVMTTPALVVDGKVVSYGKVLKKDEVIKILKNLFFTENHDNMNTRNF